MGLPKRHCFRHHNLKKGRKNRHRKVGNGTNVQIPSDVFRKKSNREYNCSITTGNPRIPVTVKTLRTAGSQRFGHLQRKKKFEKCRMRIKKSTSFEDVRLQEKEKCLDIFDHLFENQSTKNDKKLQCTEVQGASDLSTLWEDLFSSRHFRLKPVELQCYLLTQTTVLQHPTHVHGIQWENLNDEILRLATYSNYPTSATKSILILARCGFVYTGSGSDDNVMCYSCCVTKNNWLASEDVSEVHKTLSNGCSMVTGRGSNNIPVKAGSHTFEKVIHDLSLLNIDEGYDSFENEREVNKEIIESDAAPLTSQEQTQRNYERISLSNNQGRLNKSSSGSKLSSSCSNNSPVESHRGPGESSNDRFATVEQAFIVMPPSAAPAFTAQLTSAMSHESSIPQASEIQNAQANEIPKRPENSQPQRSNNTNTPTKAGNIQANSTPNNSAANLEQSSDQIAANQLKNPEPPKSHAGKSKDGKGPTYSELGIITERPKRPEYAIRLERHKTFANWPPSHHIMSVDLAEAGFYYAGYGDCARCFFCGGGLRNWEDEDDVWVEHARWFPKCAFIRQLMGQNFVDAVQDLNKTNDKITFTMVTDAMGCSASAYLIGSKTNPLLRDPAVKALIEFKYDEKTVLEIANDFKTKDVQLSADLLLLKLKEGGSPQSLESGTSASTEDQELIRQIREKNNVMRQQTMCKICMDKDVEVVFLPCGHLVSCAECAGALNDCPVCRKPVKGTVRAFIS